MKNREHIPLGVGFYPDWFWHQYGISFDRKYYFDPETRVEARMEIEKRLYERFGDVGLGSPNPEPKPLITFGMVMLPAVFGCDIVFQDDALPWAMPLNLPENEIMSLEVPDLINSSPMKEMIKQIEYLENKYGRVVGDINVTGVQNLALKLRGDQLYIDYFENPALCHHLLKICTESIIQLFKFIYKITGTGAIDVTPMCDPTYYVIPNCTVEQISLETYEKYLLQYDNQIADECHPLGIHHCGSVDQVLDGYKRVRHLKFIEIGFGSNVKRTREVFGPDVAVNARISPVLMKNGTPQEIEQEIRRLIDQGHPLHNFSIDTVGLTYGTPDENVRTAINTAKTYGKIKREEKETPSKKIYTIPAHEVKKAKLVVSGTSKELTISHDEPLVIIGERINPTGRKTLTKALEDGNFDIVISEALKQVEEGASILDVNVGVSGINEPEILKQAVIEIQKVTDVPLCIDSAIPEAIEEALKVYKGKAIINSVNGEEEKLDEILPLVKEYDSAVIALTMDEKGIPKRAEERFRIAEKIIERAQQMGIPMENIIIDCLAMAISTDPHGGLETLKAIRLINERFGVNQVLGVSNISFGLPDRDSINAYFLSMASLMGLTCAIVDPASNLIKESKMIIDLLLGKDEYCINYLNFKGRKKKPQEFRDEEFSLTMLRDAVIEGNRKKAVEFTKIAVEKGHSPDEIINRYLIPALNEVGDRFEKRIIFIPEMMMSAKSMQGCMEILSPLMKKETHEVLGTVVIGTVYGDLHDIGKNLVKLLLETSGFNVVDIGENVPPDRFVEEAIKHGAHIIGISSLLTTGDPYVEETIKAIRASEIGDKVKIICGGAALTMKFVKACGADEYARDAAEGVKKSKALLGISH